MAVLLLSVVGLGLAVVGVLRGDPGATLRAYLLLLAGLVLLEAIVGLVLLATGHRPARPLHYVYAAALALGVPAAVTIGRSRSLRAEAAALAVGCLAMILLAVRTIATGG